MLDKVTSSSFVKMVVLSGVQLFFVLIYYIVVVSSYTNISTNASGQDIGEQIIIFDADHEMEHWCYSQLDHNNEDVDNCDQTLTVLNTLLIKHSSSCRH